MLSHAIKLVLVAVGAVILTANPAFARTTQKQMLATEAFAFVPNTSGSLAGVYVVIGWDGRVVGADPDRNIRFQLMRDAFANEN